MADIPRAVDICIQHYREVAKYLVSLAIWHRVTYDLKSETYCVLDPLEAM
jgi:hypothetical protein